MGKKIKIFLAILFFGIGIFVFIYPMITDMLYKKDINNKLEEFEKIDNKINIKYDELYRLLDDRNKELYLNKQAKFVSEKSYEYDDISLSNYGIDNDIIGFLSIPSIDITLPIYLGANDTNMRLGAAHLTGTSYPIGGVNTNSVIAAHRGYYKTDMFRHIDKINIGDKLYIKNFKETLTYKAVSMEVIASDSINKLTIKDNKDMVTIISCHPYPFDYQRYVVYFERDY